MSENKYTRLLLTLIALPIIVLMLKALKAIFIPLIFAIFLSFLFAPIIQTFKRKKVPTAITLILMFVILVLFFSLAGAVLFGAVQTTLKELPKYQQQMITIAEDIYQIVHGVSERLSLAMGEESLFDPSQLLNQFNLPISTWVSGTMGTFIDVSVYFFLTMIFLLFFVSEMGKLEKRLKTVVEDKDKEKSYATMQSIQVQIQRYFFNKTLISLGTSLLGMLFLLMFGVDFVLVGGILLFTLNFIPNIGSVIASIFPILIGLLQFGFCWRVFGIGASMVFTQMLFANILEPKLMGERLNLSPLVVLISLIFWGWVWGIVGMVIAVPITSAINIVLKHFDEKNIVSAIISGN